ICPRHTLAPVRTVGRSTASVGPCIRIVSSTGGGPAIRTVNPVRDSVGAVIWVIIRTYAIGAWIRMINGVSAHGITIVRGIVISGPAGKNRSHGCASDEGSEIARSVAGLDSSLR